MIDRRRQEINSFCLQEVFLLMWFFQPVEDPIAQWLWELTKLVQFLVVMTLQSWVKSNISD
jgi:hypothetical protein